MTACCKLCYVRQLTDEVIIIVESCLTLNVRLNHVDTI